jgi:tetratricopeptide (TPR) repeat protein
MSYLKHNAQEYLLRGNNKVLLGDYKAAIFEFTKAIMTDPDLPHPYTCRSAAKLEIRDYEGAISDCQAAIKLHFKSDIEFEGQGLNKHKTSQINPVYGRLYLIMGIAKFLLGLKEEGMLDLNCARLLGHIDALDIIKTYGKE